MSAIDYVTQGSPASQHPPVGAPNRASLALDAKNAALYASINGEWQEISGSGGSSSTLAMSSTGQISPSPAYSPNEAPAGEGVTIFSQDVNGKWHQQAGMDEVTSLVNKTWAATSPFALRDSIVDQVGNIQVVTTNGTSGGSEPTFGTTLGATTTDGSVTWKCRGLNGQQGTMTFYRRTYWRDDQTANMLQGNALVGIQHMLGSGTNGGSRQDHGLYVQTYNSASDPGPIYSMTGVQCEVDLNGSPSFQPVVDGEVSCASLQLADSHTGTLDPPQYGVSCARVQYYREAGAGTWNSVGPAGLRIIMQNDSTESFAFQEMDGIQVRVIDESGAPLNVHGVGIAVLAPGVNRMDAGNVGIAVEDFGLTHGSDQAVQIAGGLCAMGVTSFQQFTVGTLPTGGVVTEGVQAYATNGRKVGETMGNGTGVPVYYSNGQWRVYSTDMQVAA